MQSSSLEKSPWGIPESPRGSGQSTKRTDCAATVRKGCPQTFGGVPSGAPPGPRDRGGIVSAARTNPHYGEDVDDKIVGTGCSEEYAKLQDCLDDTDKDWRRCQKQLRLFQQCCQRNSVAGAETLNAGR